MVSHLEIVTVLGNAFVSDKAALYCACNKLLVKTICIHNCMNKEYKKHFLMVGLSTDERLEGWKF